MIIFIGGSRICCATEDFVNVGKGAQTKKNKKHNGITGINFIHPSFFRCKSYFIKIEKKYFEKRKLLEIENKIKEKQVRELSASITI